jgi:hypothetical protein
VYLPALHRDASRDQVDDHVARLNHGLLVAAGLIATQRGADAC